MADSGDVLATAVEIARAAGAVLAQGFAGGPAPLLGVRHGAASKTAEFDLVTEFDRRSEALLVERLGQAFPRDAVIAEEGGAVGDTGGTGAIWYVDPLDGTTNFAHGLPFFAVSIARVVTDTAEGTEGRSVASAGGAGARVVTDTAVGAEGRSVASAGGAGARVVTDTADGAEGRSVASAGGARARVSSGRPDVAVVHAPILGLTFTATRGGGAYCNDRRLHVSQVGELGRAMLATGFPSDRNITGDTNYPQFIAIKSRARAVRRYGSSALDQALVAAGTFDGFWEMKLKAWDLAAGSLLVEEAGGRASGWLGEPLRLERGAIVATNGRVHDDVLALLAGAGIPEAVR